MRAVSFRPRRKAACARASAVPTPLCARLWCPCARGNRDGACVRACSVDRSASRLNSPKGRAGGEGGKAAPKPGKSELKPELVRIGTGFARLIREGLMSVNATTGHARGSFRPVTMPHKAVRSPVLAAGWCIQPACPNSPRVISNLQGQQASVVRLLHLLQARVSYNGGTALRTRSTK